MMLMMTSGVILTAAAILIYSFRPPSSGPEWLKTMAAILITIGLTVGVTLLFVSLLQ